MEALDWVRSLRSGTREECYINRCHYINTCNKINKIAEILDDFSVIGTMCVFKEEDM